MRTEPAPEARWVSNAGYPGLADQDIEPAERRRTILGEVGHAIGFVHNFKANLQDRASVMDYSGPKVNVERQAGPRRSLRVGK